MGEFLWPVATIWTTRRRNFMIRRLESGRQPAVSNSAPVSYGYIAWKWQSAGRRRYNGSSALVSAELYDPATGTWSFTGNLNQARGSHTANLLNNGKVLVAGGSSTSTDHGTLRSGDRILDLDRQHQQRRPYGDTATLLNNGKVLIAGGDDTDCTSAEVYDPTAGIWSLTGSLNAGRYFHAATLLPDGTVLAAGGLFGTFLASSELYNPTSGTWTFTGKLNQARSDQTATLLTNGVVLVAGGGDASVCSTLPNSMGLRIQLQQWMATGRSMARAVRQSFILTLPSPGDLLPAHSYLAIRAPAFRSSRARFAV